jgi:hypothetical protein
MGTSTAEAELLRIEEICGVNLIVGQHDVLRCFFRTSFRRIRSFFPFLPLPQLAYHNVLYDTLGGEGVKEPVPEKTGIVKGRLSTGIDAV